MEARRVIDPIIRLRRRTKPGAKSFMAEGYSTIVKGTINSFWSVAITWRISRDGGARRPLRKGRPTNVINEPGLNMLRRLELANNRNNTMMIENEVQREIEQQELGQGALFPQFVRPLPPTDKRSYYWNGSVPYPQERGVIWSIERAWAQVAAEQYHRWKPKD